MTSIIEGQAAMRELVWFGKPN
jgi:sugar O-acyltransferase (sialic acid O-acetyltransferase NeuD family)